MHEEVHLRLPGGHGDGAAVHGPDVEDFARLQVKSDEEDYVLTVCSLSDFWMGLLDPGRVSSAVRCIGSPLSPVFN